MTIVKITDRGPTRRSVLAGGLAAGAMLGAPAIVRAAEPVRIGIIRPLTGPLASSFEGLFASAEIALREINEAGGILGRPVEKFEVDDGGAPAQQPIAMRKLIQEGIKIVAGPVGSSQTLASLAVSTPAKILQAGYVTANEGWDASRYPYHFMCSISVSLQTELYVKSLTDRGIKKVGILVEDSAAGSSTLDALEKLLPEAGIEITGSRVFPLKSTDQTPFLRDLRNSEPEELITFVSNFIDATQLFTGLSRLGWKPPLIGHAGLFFATGLDSIPEDVKYDDIYGVSLRNLTYVKDNRPGDRIMKYLDEIKTFGIPEAGLATAATAPYYDFLKLAAHAANETESLDTEVMKEYLESLDGNFEGMFGPVAFSKEKHLAYSVNEVALARVFPRPDEIELFKQSIGMLRPRDS